MAVAYNPKIVTDGLVLALDAANSKSFNSAENLMSSSEDMSAWGAANVTYQTDVIVAPNGTLTADAVIASAADVGHYFSRGASGTTLDNTVYTFSIYVKHKGFDILHFQPVFKDGTYDRIAIWNLSTKTATTTNSGISSTITELENGWFRITSTFNSKTGASPIVPLIYIGTYGNILGDGVKGVYAWGAQVNRGSSALPYAKTTATAIPQSTTWNDLSGNGYNATLNNGPTYSLANNGSIVFDGVDDFVSFNNPLNQSNLTQIWTVMAWINITDKVSQTLIGGLNLGCMVCYSQGNNSLLYLNGGANDYYMYGGDLGNIGWVLATFRFSNASGTRTIYRNTTNISTSGPNNTSIPSGQSGTFTLGSGGSGGGYLQGNVSQLMIYNRYITDLEIQQNFNASRGRYNI